MPGTYPFNLGRGGAHLKNMGTYLDEVWRVLGVALADAHVFYVNGKDGVGDDNNSGLKPSEPLLTVTEAISKCVANRGDIIVILDYWQPTGETWPILINKHAVHIIGMAQPHLPIHAIHPPDDTACFELSSLGQYGSIGRLTIGGGVSHGGIEFGKNGQADGFAIHDCWFGHQWFGTPKHGILNPADATRGGYGMRIERCTFLGGLANCKGKITANAIELLATATAMATRDLEILDCVFKGNAKAINLYRSYDAVIARNLFVVPDSGTGEAVTLGTNCEGCGIDDNHSMSGKAADPDNNPFVDGAADGKNHWGLNYNGLTATLPGA